MKTKKTKIKESVVTPQNEVRGHTPTPWNVDCWGLEEKDWSIEDPNHKDIVRGLSQKDAEFIVRAVNSHEALLEALKKQLGKGAHNDLWRQQADKEAMDAIAQAGVNNMEFEDKRTLEAFIRALADVNLKGIQANDPPAFECLEYWVNQAKKSLGKERSR